MSWKLSPKPLVTVVTENGMLYKDITQWLRQRTFALLFIGLLGVCEVVAVMLGMAHSQGAGEQVGMVMYGILTVVLAVYGIVTAFNGHMVTSREFNDKTFELYALAGMSLEKMVFGKLVSMLMQFFFGACCIVPFLFFAYLLGGVDFYMIITALVVLALCAPPLFLMTLLVASNQRAKALRVVFTIVFVIITINLVYVGMAWFFMRGMSGGAHFTLVADLLSGSRSAWVGLAVFTGFYLQFCTLLFYLCAQTMRPSTDSREHIVKLLIFTLVASFGGLLVYNSLGGRTTHTLTVVTVINTAGYESYFMSTYFLLLILSVAYFFGSMRIPIMVRRRQEALCGKVGPQYLLKRFVYYWFLPGPIGFMRTLLLLELLIGAVGAWFWIEFAHNNLGNEGNFLHFLSLPLCVPFFISFPAIIFYSFRKTAQMKMMGALVLIFWLLAAVACQVPFIVHQANSQALGSGVLQVVLWINTVLSPISTLTSESWGEQFTLTDIFYWARFVMGVVGVICMIAIVRQRKVFAAEPLKLPVQPGLPPSSASGPGGPPPIPRTQL